MKKLEKLAEELFERFCEKELGRRGNWRYLAKDRQVAWMEEALMSIHLVIDSLQQTVKPVTVASKYDTLYLQGFYNGQAAERTTFIGFLQEVKDTMEDELENFKNNNN